MCGQKEEHGEKKSEHREGVNTSPERNSDSRGYPERGGGGESLRSSFAEDNDTGADKTDTDEHLRGDARGIYALPRHAQKPFGGDDAKKRRTERNERKRARAGGFVNNFALKADAQAEKRGGKKAEEDQCRGVRS